VALAGIPRESAKLLEPPELPPPPPVAPPPSPARPPARPQFRDAILPLVGAGDVRLAELARGFDEVVGDLPPPPSSGLVGGRVPWYLQILGLAGRRKMLVA
jgi:hypothetical protein